MLQGRAQRLARFCSPASQKMKQMGIVLQGRSSCKARGEEEEMILCRIAAPEIMGDISSRARHATRSCPS